MRRDPELAEWAVLAALALAVILLCRACSA